jgi:hypothetical protein
MATLGSLAFAASAGAATLAVDDDGVDCPAAPYTSIQAAVDAAQPGDTVAVCAGTYAEGSGAVGTNALTITKSITLKGAGADLVTISPKSSGVVGGQIMEATPNLRNGIGDIVAVVGAPTAPISVDISGVSVDGYAPGRKPVAVEAGILYLDAKGSISRSRVTNVVTSEGAEAYNDIGGYRGTQPGIGIVQTSASRTGQYDGTRVLAITSTRVDKYNKIGVLIDGAQGDTPPLVSSGVINRGELNGNQIVGRTQCIDFQSTGNCSVVGDVQNSALTTGPLFGQDGVRVTAGARAQVIGTLLSQNLVNGTGSPVRSSVATNGTVTNVSTNNANLTLGAGFRAIGAKMTTPPVSTGLHRTFETRITESNIVDNAYGALNYAADGTTANTGTTADGGTSATSNVLWAENNWWGLRIRPAVTTNTGPVISPTVNPPWPENPVGGAAATDPVSGGATSSSVAFFPFRSSVPSDPGDPSKTFDPVNPRAADTVGGEFPVQDAPYPIYDAAPDASALSAGTASVDAGKSATLTATASDDFGVKRVRFYDGSTLVGTVTKPPYSQAITVPANAACGSTRSYTAVVTDSIDQSASVSTSLQVTCPTPTPGGGGDTPNGGDTKPAPTISFGTTPTTIKGSTSLAFNVNAAAGVKSIQVRLGDRVVCTVTAAPYACKVTPTGADVGKQTLVAVVTDNAGNTAVASTSVTVPKFAAKVSLAVKTSKAKGGKKTRTVTGTLKRPSGVTQAQGCKGKVTVVIKRSGRSVLNQQVSVSKKCTFSRKVTASSKKQSFSVSAKFGGNTVLAKASSSRRFS